uniref:Uncharacterized protein n=1 Tax=Nelumbo nucifera TaxID=4432 RepID=A0A822XRC8_NELNU|nr:TPA_asm: hypothetical protein HUJ06_023164 [Nelumbo nucifera]
MQNLQLIIRRKSSPILGDAKSSVDVIFFTTISLGFISVASCIEDAARAIIFALMDRNDSELLELFLHRDLMGPNFSHTSCSLPNRF